MDWLLVRTGQKAEEDPDQWGASEYLCDANKITGASWDTDDTIVYAEAGTGIMKISPNGGNPELLVKQTGLYFVAPRILSDGKTLLFTCMELERNKIIVKSLKSGEQEVLIEGEAIRYLPTVTSLTQFAIFFMPFRTIWTH